MTAEDLVQLLRRRYSPSRYAFFEQVANGTGWRGVKRWLDVVVMELWPSDGLNVYGFEVKVSRGDWLRELRDMSKSDAIARYCSAFYVVAPAGVVHPMELPPGWGLFEPYVDAGFTELRAMRAGAMAMPPPLLDRTFIAALARCAARLEASA